MTERAYRYRFYPTAEQENLLRRTLGCVRLVFNKALALQTEAWYERQERMDYVPTSATLTQWKKQEDLQFLHEVSCVPLQQGLRHLQKGFANFFDGRIRYPRFKRKHNGGSAEFTKSAFKYRSPQRDGVLDGQLYLAKCEDPLPVVWSRALPDGVDPSTVTVKLDPSGRWFVSLLVNDPTVEALPVTDGAVGIDAGLTSLVTLSSGEKISNLRHFHKHRRKLKQVQKFLSRKQKGSKNRDKARHKVARQHAKIADSRKDFLHKLSTRLVRENQTIVVEDLAVQNMVKNHKLANSIADAGWGELVRMLGYKCTWYGRTLVKIDRWFPSSKRCGHCGYIVASLPLDIREWECSHCQTVHDRDINAARNILAAGQAVTVCGANVRPVDGTSCEARHESGGQLRKTRKGRKQKPKL
ncbi:MAG: RNA-guided endonuclease TnpB family protein [Cyanobacteriota bacterium]|nr:RNA-guided endonuclease TnpB family protein [Cyanobacteriota bacterium]